MHIIFRYFLLQQPPLKKTIKQIDFFFSSITNLNIDWELDYKPQKNNMNTIQKEASELHTIHIRTYPDKILLVPDPLMNMINIFS